MRRTWITAAGFSLGLLLGQGTDFAPISSVADAQDRSEATASQSAPRDTTKPPSDKATPAASDKATPATPAKSEEAAAKPAASKRGAGKERARSAKATSAPEAEQGQIEERNERASTPVTALESELQPAELKTTATPVPEAPSMADPKLKVAPPVNAPPPPSPAEAARDQALRERVQAALLTNSSLSYTARLVSVQVRNGEITLRGQLNTQFEKVNAERAVDRVRGDHVVHNKLTVRMPNAMTSAPAP